MRCVECHTEPLTPGHYCECCGRKLSLQERKGLETGAAPAAAPPEVTGPVELAAAATKCESCGAPADHGDLCAACHRAFQPVLDRPSRTTPPSDPAARSAETISVREASLETEISSSGLLPHVARLLDAAEVAAETPSPLFAEVVMGRDADLEAATAEADRAHAAEAEGVRIKAVRAEAARIVAARLEIEKIEARRRAPKPSTPPAVSQRAVASVPPSHGVRSMVGLAAAVVLAAAAGLGLSAYWFEIPGLPFPGRAQETPLAPSAEATEPPHPPALAERAPDARRTASSSNTNQATAGSATGASKVRSSPSRAASAQVPAKATRQPAEPERQVASAVASTGLTAAPVHEAPPPAEPAAAASTAPLRPFFEAKDVNQAPQVVGRVKPKLPHDLQAHEVNDVVVVRLLVSQSGHPSSVSLLRRSRAGRSLDDAVIAAVKQWSFSPARKKGENVSCWLNVGVPVGRI